MTPKPVIPRAQARRDAVRAIDHYAAEAGEKVALGFVDALESAYLRLARRPALGSPRYGHELDLPGLRTWRLARYPYLVFYVELVDRIDVWRILHDKRDIPATMREA